MNHQSSCLQVATMFSVGKRFGDYSLVFQRQTSSLIHNSTFGEVHIECTSWYSWQSWFYETSVISVPLNPKQMQGLKITWIPACQLDKQLLNFVCPLQAIVYLFAHLSFPSANDFLGPADKVRPKSFQVHNAVFIDLSAVKPNLKLLRIAQFQH